MTNIRSTQWQILPDTDPPEWLVTMLQSHYPNARINYAAKLLANRGITPEKLLGFVDYKCYQPCDPMAFGQEILWAIERILKARNNSEKIAIWGDFDADGVTSTAVLWDGLGEFFTKYQQLIYYIPNRLTESHGLNRSGIDGLASMGVSLIITCDTGSTNQGEIAYAQTLGIEIIVTDHHTLPSERPPVVAIINPRYLPTDHPLFNLSGVAVAYKLIEALYLSFPDVPQRPLTDLLDLVVIGLIADLVQLTGDCRYLAQIGLEKLKNTTRPGLIKLLKLCKQTGDRPADISFGLGPRINAVSRIKGDANFCVELLTSQDADQCHILAEETELANTRRQGLQKDVLQDALKKVADIDLSTTGVIVLTDPQWPVGVLGLVAGQIAQTYARPTILLTTQEFPPSSPRNDEQLLISDTQLPIVNDQLARGSARSIAPIDLYDLVASQAHLLHRFGGHPFAAGLSLRMENLPLFIESINQQIKQKIPNLELALQPVITIDLTLTVAELEFKDGSALFQELKLIEPCGMGNPVPRLLIKNCWFDQIKNFNQRDLKKQTVRYIKTQFELWDDTCQLGFPGVWWEHYADELPKGRCDAIFELDFNPRESRYEVRLIDVRKCENDRLIRINQAPNLTILDWRNREKIDRSLLPSNICLVTECPTNWDDLRVWFRKALGMEATAIALFYHNPVILSPQETWQKLVGIAKYLSRVGQMVTRLQLKEKLGISDICLRLGFECLKSCGFQIKSYGLGKFVFSWNNAAINHVAKADRLLAQLGAAMIEEQFQKRYFCEVSLSTIEAIAQETIMDEISQEAIDF